MSSTEPLGQTDSADSDSEVWQFFTKDDDDDDYEPVALCNQDGCKFNADIEDYACMWNHLNGSHAEIYKGTARYKTKVEQLAKSERADVGEASGEASSTGTDPPLGSSSEHGPPGASPSPDAEKAPYASPKAEDEIGGFDNDDNASDFNKSETPPKDDDDEMDFERDSDAFYDQLRSKKMADEKKHAASPKNDDDEKNFEDAKTLQTHFGASAGVGAPTSSSGRSDQDTDKFFVRLKSDFKKLADEKKYDVLLKMHQSLNNVRKPGE